MANTISSYVKFLRGTPDSFSRLTVKDPDTMYFIREKNARTGSLYIGDTLISGSTTIQELDLEHIKEIEIDNDNLNDGDILVYSHVDGVWKNKSHEEAVSVDLNFLPGKDMSVTAKGKNITYSHSEIQTSVQYPEEGEGQLVVSKIESENGHIKKIIYSYISVPAPMKMEWGTF